jgi:hypothetical protein
MQSKLSQVQAARAAGVSRATIYRAIKQGRLSQVHDTDGSMHIDASELLRVFPDADLERAREHVRESDTGTNGHALEHDEIGELAALRDLVRELRDDKHHLRQEREQLLTMLRDRDESIARKDELLAEQMQTVKLLTDQRERKRRWWPWRRGI